MEDLAKFLLVELLGEAVKGWFCWGYTNRIRRIRTAAWISLAVAVTLSIAIWWPQVLNQNVAGFGFLAALFFSFAFGFWVSVEYARYAATDGAIDG